MQLEDEDLLNMILERLYAMRNEDVLSSVRGFLNESGLYFRKNQLNRVMSEIRTNGFGLISRIDDDFQAEILPEGIVYCEEVLLLR